MQIIRTAFRRRTGLTAMAVGILLVVVISAATAPTASAGKKGAYLIFQTEKRVLGRGAEVLLSNSSTLELTSSAGAIDCAPGQVLLHGTAGHAPLRRRALPGGFTSATFASCESTLAMGRVELSAPNVPWPFEFNLRSGPRGKAEERQLTLAAKKIVLAAAFPEASERCEYEAKEAAFGWYEGVAARVEASQLFTRRATSSTSCPKEATLAASFSVTSGGEVVEARRTP